MEKPKMTEFEAETRAEYIAYNYMIGRLSADTSNADKKKREYARQLLEIAEQRKEKEMNRLREKYEIGK
jgi:hypothetical protein